MLWGLGGNSKIFLKMLEENFCGNFEVTGIFENSLDSIPFKTKLPIFKTQKELYNLIKVSTHFIISIGGNGLARYEVSKKLLLWTFYLIALFIKKFKELGSLIGKW